MVQEKKKDPVSVETQNSVEIFTEEDYTDDAWGGSFDADDETGIKAKY